MKNQLVRAIVLALTFFTGFTALVYEVTWHYYLANLLGSQARSASLIVATFLGGLAIGYALFGRYTQKHPSRSLVRACGVLEILIGVWALGFPFLHEGVWSLQGVLRSASGGLFSDLFISALLIGAPTIMMGASLPLLTQGLSRSLADASSLHAKIYVVNTFGAFAGTFVAGFFLIPAIGLSATMFWMGCVNIGAGGILAWVASWLPETANAVDDSPELSASPFSKRVAYLCLIGFLGGFVSITLQTVLIRVMALSVGASTYAFALVVSGFILMLALGAWLLAGQLDKIVSLTLNQFFIVLGLTALYFVLPYLPYTFHVYRTLLTSNWISFWVYHVGVFVAFCVVAAIPVGAIGATLPLLFKESRDRMELLGRRVGAVYGANTFGCVLGAIFGGYLSLYYFNLDGVLRICVSLSAFTLLIVALGHTNRLRPLIAIVAPVLAALPLSFTPWPENVMSRGLFRMTQAGDYTYKGFTAFYKHHAEGQRIVARKDDPNSTIAVVDTGDGARSIVVNGKSDGSTRGGDRTTVVMLAHLPALLQKSDSDRVAVVGFGTGITVGTFSRYDEFKHVDVLEISSAVKSFAPHFDAENGNASQSPKLEWHLGDAYRYLIDSKDKYAIIASEPSNPWVGGVERLYSTDFYKVVRQKLAPGGIYAQWFHSYSISTETMALVLNTFRASFPYVHLFERSADLILIGSEHPLDESDVARMRDRYSHERVATELKDVGISSFDAILRSEVWAPWEGVTASPIHSLDKPKLSYWAGRDFFLDEDAKISNMADMNRYRGATRKSYFNTLLAQDVKGREKIEQLKAVAQVSCRIDRIEYFSNWDRTTPACKESLVALTVLGEIGTTNDVTQRVVSLFRNLDASNTDSVEAEESVGDAMRGLDWVRDYGAPFLSVDAGRLRTYAGVCFQRPSLPSVDCRGKLVRALAANGYIDEARDEFARLRNEDLPIDNPAFFRGLAEVVGYTFTPEERARIEVLENAD